VRDEPSAPQERMSFGVFLTRTSPFLFACILHLSDGTTENGDDARRCTSSRPPKCDL